MSSDDLFSVYNGYTSYNARSEEVSYTHTNNKTCNENDSMDIVFMERAKTTKFSNTRRAGMLKATLMMWPNVNL